MNEQKDMRQLLNGQIFDGNIGPADNVTLALPASLPQGKQAEVKANTGIV